MTGNINISPKLEEMDDQQLMTLHQQVKVEIDRRVEEATRKLQGLANILQVIKNVKDIIEKIRPY